MTRHLIILTALAAVLVGPPPAGAVLRDWDDGGLTKNWTDQFNWTGDMIPGTMDHASIGSLATAKDDTVIFNFITDTVNSLDVVGGADLDTDGGGLVVNAGTVVGQPGTGGTTASELIVRPTMIIGQPTAIETGTLDVGQGGRLEMRGGRLSINGAGLADGVLQSTSLGAISGYGTINLDDAEISAPNASLFIHEGDLTVGVSEEQDGMSEPPARTLTINKPDALSWAQFELAGSIELLRNTTLDINQGGAVSLVAAKLGVFGCFGYRNRIKWLAQAPLQWSICRKPVIPAKKPASEGVTRLTAPNQGTESIGGFTIRRPTITMRANSHYERDFVTHVGNLLVNSGAVTTGETTLPAAPAVVSGGMVAQTCLDDMCNITTFTNDAELIFEAQYNGFSGSVINLGTIRFAGDANIGPGVTFQPSGGALVNENGSTLTLYDDANVDTPLQNAGVIELGTDIVPDNALGQVQLRNYTQLADGELRIDLGGILVEDFDMMTVPGNAVLDGTLRVELINSFLPVLGNSLTIIETTVGNVAGEFDQENVPVFGGLTFDVIYNPQSVVLEVVEFLPGDYNEDGFVNAADYVVWRNQNGTPFDLPNRDPSQNGEVNQADYQFWVDNFGNTAQGGAAAAAVPEPGAVMVLAVFAFLTCGVRRRAAASACG